MSQHPLIDLSNDREVKQARGFRKAAAEMTGEGLAAQYRQELENAPRRADAGKSYLGNHPGKPPTERRNNRDEEHLSGALVRHCRERDLPLHLPREAGQLRLLEYAIPMQTASADRAKGDDDPNKGVGKVDLIGIGPEDVLAVVRMRFLEPDATRGGTGDTPLRQILEALAHTAMVEANRKTIQEEVLAAGGPTFSEDPPMLVLMASPRYWQLCRKREAQKGAAWIKELERLSREVGDEIGVQIVYVGLTLEGNPGWTYDEQGPLLPTNPHLEPAWERNAGRVKPKASPKSRPGQQADEIVEADLTRSVRDYSIRDSYESGERIQHPTLGLGVVQGTAGAGKIVVLFDERKSLLVHERA